jgi:hypothetical protein
MNEYPGKIFIEFPVVNQAYLLDLFGENIIIDFDEMGVQGI